MTVPIRAVVGTLAVAIAIVASTSAQGTPRPLDVARVLAVRYPESPIMSYIPGVAWSSALGLARLTGEEKWSEKARQDMHAFLAGGEPSIAQPYLLTSLAGHAALSDLAAVDENAAAAALAKKAADFILAESEDEILKFRRRWTDDMFMATTLLARVAAREKDARYARTVGRLLTSYAASLQRPDGLFIHALEAPHAWGRGNGFALLGLTEALTHLPPDWPDRARVLEIYRTHVRAMLKHQADDGSWRQVVDEPTSYRELTVTAITVSALARGVRLGWLPRAEVSGAIDRGWRAVVARVNGDGTLRDVCSGTGAGPTKEYYLTRPVINGADDRGGALAMLAAVEVEELARAANAQAAGSLQSILQRELAPFPGRAGVWVKHLVTGEEAGVRADEVFNSASVIKIPVLMRAFELADTGQLSLSERVTIRKQDVRGGSGVFRHHDAGLQPTMRDVLLQMVITSDNTATDIAIGKVGGVERVNAWLSEHAYGADVRLTQTTASLFSKYDALPTGAPRHEKTNHDRDYWLGTMTPRMTGRMLEEIHACSSGGAAPGKAASGGRPSAVRWSRGSCDDMLRMLRAQQAGARRLPHFLAVPVAHKTGDFPPVLANDVGIVFARTGPIVISFFANAIEGNYGEAEDRIGRIALRIVEYFDN